MSVLSVTENPFVLFRSQDIAAPHWGASKDPVRQAGRDDFCF